MIAQFSLRLICGMSLMWACMPRNQVTSGFFRIQMLVALGLSVLSSLTMGRLTAEAAAEPMLSPQAATWGCVVLAVLAFLGSVMWTLERRRAGTYFVFLIAAVSTVVLLLSSISEESMRSLAGPLHGLSELASAALLGGATTGMLLGHWYLTAPTMSIAPLGRLTQFFGVAAVARLVVSAILLTMVWSDVAGPTQSVWLGLRWLAGVLGPLVVFVMAWRILKYRNTQAATGVLFVGVILTFIGEMTAVLLYHEMLTPV